MPTVLEIEKVIEQLPELDQRKLVGWFEEHRLILESSAALGAMYDEEDGGESQLCEA
jgi:hypothetical protein